MRRSRLPMLALTFAFVASTIPAQPLTIGTAAPIAAAASDPLDGESAFRGLAFGQGPVARRLPEIADAPAHDAGAAAIVDDVIAAVRATDPSFFGRFGAAMQSGDRIQIREALDEGRTRLWAAMDQLYPRTRGGTVDPDCVFVAVVVVVTAAAVLFLLIDVNTVVVMNYMVTYNAMVNIEYAIESTPDATGARGSTLLADRMVDSIARHLKTATA